MKYLAYWIILSVIGLQSTCAYKPQPAPVVKYKGMHIFSRNNGVDHDMQRLQDDHVTHLAFVPYGWQEDQKTTEIRHTQKDSLDQWTRRDSIHIRLALKANTYGMQVIMKPHIWMRNAGEDEWRNAINFETEEEWLQWETNYRNFILHYAELAETLDMPLLCIGVELRSTVQQREAFWRSLINDVRQIYSGKLTYGANWWEEYKEVPFWDALDYVGIQAYFPLTDSDQPTLEAMKAGWTRHHSLLEQFSKNKDRPILFTEIGYLNIANTTNKPWEWPEAIDADSAAISPQAQADAYEAFFHTFWNEEWFAGALFWQWRIHRPDYVPRRPNPISFSPKNQPAQKVMQEWFNH